MRILPLLSLVIVTACSSTATPAEAPAPTAELALAPPTSTGTAVHMLEASTPARAASAGCAQPVQVFRGGQAVAARCPDEARAAGLTVLELGDAWTPYPLHDAAVAAGAAPPAYHGTFVALAAGDFAGDAQAEHDRYLELYGVPPNLRVVLAAMDDDARHRCHDTIADDPLAELALPLRREPPERVADRRRELARLQAQVDGALRHHDLTDRDELAALGPSYARRVERLARAEQRDAAITAVQRHLVCDGLLTDHRPGGFDYATSQALALYQRRHWIVGSGEFDADTRDALQAGSRELDLRLALRVLRHRVVDAAGLLEDGSAAQAWGVVLGRQLDPSELRPQADAPLANAAPDLIAPATEAAAVALGWRDFVSVRASLRAHLGEVVQVAIELPPLPRYHGPAMNLRAVLDRGDVVAADPRTRRGHALTHKRQRRPMLIVYASDGDREVALVRWPTTIGGWKPEKLESGAVVRKLKASDVGPRLWRDLVVAPAWYAPPSTPDAELVGVRDGRWSVKQDLIGPGYRSAYGLVMLVHHEAVARRDRVHMLDHGIRTHGSVSYRSILTGDSHGCHRLYNLHALRLATFLLRHRAHAVRGPVAQTYARRVRHAGRRWNVDRKVRGYAYELTPPVPIEVLVGQVLRICDA